MRKDDIRDILLDSSSISSIRIEEHESVCGIPYTFVVHCGLAVGTDIIRLLIGIGEHWEQELFDFYIEDYVDFPFLPHVSRNGKICLYDLEGVLIDANFEGILTQCVNQAKSIIEDGIEGRNQEDFIKEFDSYWGELSGLYLARVCINHNERKHILKYVNTALSQSKRRKREKYAAYRKRVSNKILFASDDYSMFERWGAQGTQRNGVYIDVYSSEYIFPPDPREPMTLDYINNLLCMVDATQYTEAIRKMKSEQCLIFFLHQPNRMEMCIGVLIQNASYKIMGSRWEILYTSKTEIYPLRVDNLEKSNLMKRVECEGGLNEKSCLLVGCGSIGGYLLNEMVKSGMEKITIVDDDRLNPENIYRHFLGAAYIDYYKTVALASYFNRNIPSSRIRTLEEEIRDAIEEGDVDFNDFDIIVSATGNHNINRWINSYMWQHAIEKPVFYVWNEPLDIGCHVAVVSAGKAGCYECFFQKSEELMELFDSTSYTLPGQKVTKDLTGCGSSFVPYSSSISLKSAALCMEWIVKTVNQGNQQNVLVSMKSDGYYFEKSGLKVSDNYLKQTEMVAVKNGSEFIRQECAVCGRRSHNLL